MNVKRQTTIVFHHEIMTIIVRHHLNIDFSFLIFIIEIYYVHDINSDYHTYFILYILIKLSALGVIMNYPIKLMYDNSIICAFT